MIWSSKVISTWVNNQCSDHHHNYHLQEPTPVITFLTIISTIIPTIRSCQPQSTLEWFSQDSRHPVDSIRFLFLAWRNLARLVYWINCSMEIKPSIRYPRLVIIMVYILWTSGVGILLLLLYCHVYMQKFHSETSCHFIFCNKFKLTPPHHISGYLLFSFLNIKIVFLLITFNYSYDFFWSDSRHWIYMRHEMIIIPYIKTYMRSLSKKKYSRSPPSSSTKDIHFHSTPFHPFIRMIHLLIISRGVASRRLLLSYFLRKDQRQG